MPAATVGTSLTSCASLVFQYYWNVGGNSRVPDAAVMRFRVIIDF
jgi:hypothetical protein